MREGGHHAVAAGHPDALRLTGRVVDGAGEPVTDALVEVWGLDPDGRPGPDSDVDGFTGAGRAAADATGTYRVRVLAPPATTTVDGVPQAPHLDVVVHARGLLRHLVTRAYVLPADPDEAAATRAADPVLSGLDAAGDGRAERVLARRGDGVLRLDIHLQGAHETPFFDV